MIFYEWVKLAQNSCEMGRWSSLRVDSLSCADDRSPDPLAKSSSRSSLTTLKRKFLFLRMQIQSPFQSQAKLYLLVVQACVFGTRL